MTTTNSTPDRRETLHALWGLGALMLSGCGGGGSDTPSPAAPGTAPDAAAPAPSPAPAPSTGSGSGTYGTLSLASAGNNASLNGALPFPSSNAWNTDISAAPVDPASTALLASIGLSTGLRPDFGAGTWNGGPIGIPYVVVSGTQAPVAVNFVAYASESDAGPYPVPGTAEVEGGANGTGDRHVLVLDKDHNRLYELYRAFPNSNGSWSADCGAVFHLDSNTMRPTAQPGWTSADAAGLPIFPGLVRYD